MIPELICLYFSFGCGFYIGTSVARVASFVSADLASLLRGILLGLVFWPIGLIIQTIYAVDESRREP